MVTACLRPICPFRPAITPVPLPLARAIFTGTVVTGTIITRTIVAWALITRTVVALAQLSLAAITIAIITRPIITGPVITGPVITGPVITGPFVAAVAAVVGARITSLGFVPGVVIAGIARIAVAIHGIIIKAVTALAAIVAAFGLAITIIAEHAIIMFGILQIIFCRHPITGLLRVARQRPIFFQQLGGIAALAVIQPRAIIIATSHLLRARTAVAATAPPPLVVPDQDRRPRCLALSGR